MHILTTHDARAILRGNRFGVLSLSHAGDAYGLPLFYGYDGNAIYFHTLPGAKLRYIETTKEACFTVSVVHNLDEWSSVQAFGPIERVDGTPSALAALHALMVVPLPPEFGLSDQGEPARAEKGHVYRLTLERISGRHSAPAKTMERAQDLLSSGV